MNNKTRKLLVPLGTLLLAAGVTFGSGATWTSEHSMTASVTGGHLLNTSDHDKTPALTIAQLKPGVQKDGVITLTEDPTNDVDGTLALTASNVDNKFDDQLQVRVTSSTEKGATSPTDTGWESATVLGTAGGTLPLVKLPAGFGHATITISIRLLDDTDGSDQGKTATADLDLVTTSTTDSNTNTSVNWN